MWTSSPGFLDATTLGAATSLAGSQTRPRGAFPAVGAQGVAGSTAGSQISSRRRLPAATVIGLTSRRSRLTGRVVASGFARSIRGRRWCGSSRPGSVRSFLRDTPAESAMRRSKHRKPSSRGPVSVVELRRDPTHVRDDASAQDKRTDLPEGPAHARPRRATLASAQDGGDAIGEEEPSSLVMARFPEHKRRSGHACSSLQH